MCPRSSGEVRWLGTDGKGHAGLNLLVTSSTALALGLSGWLVNAVIILSTILSTLPDIDLRLELPHRKYTHNVLFALLAGSAAGIVTSVLGFGFELGFYSVCVGVLTHILGDLLTYRSFAPLYPLVRRRFSFRLFHSSNKYVNSIFLLLGSAAYFVYLVKLVEIRNLVQFP